MLTRREMLKLGLLATGSSLLSAQCSVLRRLGGGLESPPTARFPEGWDLTVPPVLEPAPLDPGTERLEAGTGVTYHLTQEERLHRFHPDLPESPIWGYQGQFPGPTVHARAGEPAVVRISNDLPGSSDFGVSRTVTHLHGGHQASRDDGFPTDLLARGNTRDHLYPNVPAGGDPAEIPSTLWYHDHLIDFTAENVYKGLLGLYLMFDELDGGDETDPRSLRLPSGPFDIPLVFTDKLFSPDTGRLIYDPFDHDGFLGDRVAVNGRIQPTLDVYRRKYRFRLVNASNARFYEFFLRLGRSSRTLSRSFHQIATDGGLLPHPLQLDSFLLTNGERLEVVVDFSRFREGEELILENRVRQWDGRGPNRRLSPDEPGSELLRFRVMGNPPDGDPSRVPPTLRSLPTIPARLDAFPRYDLVFDRRSGAWVINDQFFDQDVPLFTVPLGSGAILNLRNDSARWWHPIHFHLEFFQILSRNGKPPAPHELGKKDTVILGPKDEVEIFMRFRDHPGRYVLHCHNLEHEDMFMMARYDVV